MSMRGWTAVLAAAAFAGSAWAGDDKPKKSDKDEGMSLLRQGKFLEAEQKLGAFMNADEKNRSDKDVLYAIGVSYLGLGHQTVAIEFLGRAQARDYDGVRVQVLIALARLSMDRPREEWRTTIEVLASRPPDYALAPVIKILYGGGQAGEFKVDDVIKEVKEKDKALTLALAGLALRATGRDEAAEKVLDDALKAAPEKDAPIEVSLARSALEQVRLARDSREKLKPTVDLKDGKPDRSKIAPLKDDEARKMIDPKSRYFVVLDTSEGRVEIELMAGSAPITCANVVYLARNGWYDGLSIGSRSGVVATGSLYERGGDLWDKTGGPGWRVKDEIKGRTDNRHVRGSVSLSNFRQDGSSRADTGAAVFFICLREAPSQDGDHTVFGRITRGMETVERFQRQSASAEARVKSAAVYVEKKAEEKKAEEK
jgi:peptidyl-prolyl cis-trans isomerase B (cyclophilin B)